MMDVGEKAREVSKEAWAALGSPMLRTVAPGAQKSLGALVDLVEQMAHEIEILKIRVTNGGN